MIHVSRLHILLAKKDKNANPAPFSLKFIKANGELVNIEHCICTSFHSAHRTFNIRITPSGEFRKVRLYSVVELNNTQMYV